MQKKHLICFSKSILVVIVTFSLLLQKIPVSQAFSQTSTDSAQKANTLPLSSSPIATQSPNPSIPTINIETKAQQTSAFIRTSPVVQRLAKRYYRSDEEVLVSIMNPQDDSFQVA